MSSIGGSNLYPALYPVSGASGFTNDNSSHNSRGPAKGDDALIAKPGGYDNSVQDSIDNDSPRHNPLDSTAGDDAEVFDPNTQSWQPTQAAGNGQYAALGDPYREAIDFEITPDNMGGWQRA
jgi:hypothetical protein